MNRIAICLVSSVLFFVQIQADTQKKADEEKVSIETLIEKVKKSSPTNRRIAINRLKIRLKGVNIDARRKIMQGLHASLGGRTVKTAPVQTIPTRDQHSSSTLTPAQTASPSTIPVPRSIPTQSPTLPVRRPTLPLKRPALPVKMPTLPVKMPNIPAKMPTLPVKMPSIPAKMPTLPVKIPTLPVKMPTLPVKMPFGK